LIAPPLRAGGGKRAGLAILMIFVFVTQAQEDVPMSLFPLWDRSFSVRTAFGYKDNVLLSPVNSRGSAFFSSGLEASVFRLAEDGTQLTFLLTADNNHYFSVPQLDNELLVLAQMQLQKPFASEWRATLAFDYFYQDQVLDVSATETNQLAVEVEGHNFQIAPALRRNLGAADWLEISAPVARRIFNDPLDSFWEGGPKLAYGRSYGRKSEWIASYSFTERAYDTRTETTSTNTSIPGTHREFRQHKVELASWHFWDEPRRWRTVTKLSYRRNEDNGSGYFDYDKFQFSEQLRFRAKPWELLAEVRFGHYSFDVQTVSATDSSLRQLSEFTWHLRAERQFKKWLKGYVDFEQERNYSNQPLERYTVNTVSGGCIVEF
jgi:hypothetical protein